MEQPVHQSRRFYFWQQWLFYSSILFAIFGLVLAFYGNNPLFSPYHRMLAVIFFDQEALPDNTRELYTFIMGPMGATITGFYLMLACIARYPFKRKERWARNAIIIAFGAWFVTDAVVSIYYGVYFQALVLHLLVSVPQKALPLIFTWKEFNR